MTMPDRFDNQPAPRITVRRRRVKYSRIRVHPDGALTVTVPPHATDADIERLLARKSRWIERHRARFRERERNRPRPGPDEILYRGELWRVIRDPREGREVAADPATRTLRTGLDLTCDSVRERWLREEARRLVHEALDRFAASGNFRWNRVYIRGQKTRWGSCSSRGNLSFNWRLAEAPPFVLEYVVAHELMHTRRMDHSRLFHRDLARLFPRAPEAGIWLRDHGVLTD